VARDTLNNIDTAFLHLDDPTNLMMITGVMIFKSPLDFERLRATVEARLLSMARFRQRVVWPRLGRGNPYWEDDPDFDLRYHLQRTKLPPPGGQAALQDVVSLLSSTPLDLAKPLWQFHLVENYAECCALVMRFHHCIADGTSLIHVILSLTDAQPDAPWPAVPSRPSRPSTQERSSRSRSLATLVQSGLDLLSEPSRLTELREAARDATGDFGRFLLLKPDPNTALNGELGVAKRAAWSEAVPLAQIQIIRSQLGGTVNDVLLTVATGALRRYMQSRGDPVDQISIRAAVPVDVRTEEAVEGLGNHVGAMFVTLPVSIADPACRLGEVQRGMDERKESQEAPVFSFLLNALGMAPPQIANALISAFSTRGSVVMTNVRGPRERLYLAGSPLDSLLPWAPTTGRIGIAVSVLSYAGDVRLGLLTDGGLVPNPEAIVEAFHAEFEALLTRALKEEALRSAANQPRKARASSRQGWSPAGTT
jgi:diacylglycerol O-acyltransferase